MDIMQDALSEAAHRLTALERDQDAFKNTFVKASAMKELENYLLERLSMQGVEVQCLGVQCCLECALLESSRTAQGCPGFLSSNLDGFDKVWSSTRLGSSQSEPMKKVAKTVDILVADAQRLAIMHNLPADPDGPLLLHALSLGPDPGWGSREFVDALCGKGLPYNFSFLSVRGLWEQTGTLGTLFTLCSGLNPARTLIQTGTLGNLKEVLERKVTTCCWIAKATVLRCGFPWSVRDFCCQDSEASVKDYPSRASRTHPFTSPYLHQAVDSSGAGKCITHGG
eukprot:1160143-Pelagomonas_calceolata.AAC.3